MSASMRGHAATVRVLVNAGADKEAANAVWERMRVIFSFFTHTVTWFWRRRNCGVVWKVAFLGILSWELHVEKVGPSEENHAFCYYLSCLVPWSWKGWDYYVEWGVLEFTAIWIEYLSFVVYLFKKSHSSSRMQKLRPISELWRTFHVLKLVSGLLVDFRKSLKWSSVFVCFCLYYFLGQHAPRFSYFL
jgi:hypothetical protein